MSGVSSSVNIAAVVSVVGAGLVAGIYLAPAAVVGTMLVSPFVAGSAAVAPTYFLGIPWGIFQTSAGSAAVAAIPAVYANVMGVTAWTYALWASGGVIAGGGASSLFINNRPIHAPGPTDADFQRQERAQQAAEQAAVISAHAAAQAAQAQSREAAQRAAAAVQSRETAERELQDAREAIRDAEDQRQYPVPNYLKSAIDSCNVNIAIAGQAGVGKSSYINAIRKVKKGDPGYAGTGVVQTTMNPTMYKFPARIGILRRISARVLERFHRNENPDRSAGGVTVGDRIIVEFHDQPQMAEITRLLDNEFEVRLEDGASTTVPPRAVKGIFADANLWDLPGVGTSNHPQAAYLRAMGIRYFDMVVLITAERFTEAEKKLKDELDHWNVPYFLVRNKVDSAVEDTIDEEDDVSDERKLEIKEQTVAELKAYFMAELGMDRVYTISTKLKFRDDYDFRQLENDMGVALTNVRGVTMERECPVCLETYADFPNGTAGTRQALRPCLHTCCDKCLAEVQVRGHQLCPICRMQLGNSSRPDASADRTALSV